MKYIISALIFVVSICSTETYSQTDSIKTGAFRNHLDFNNNIPMYECEFVFAKKNDKSIPELHGVTTVNCKVEQKIIDKVVWAIYDGDSFFLNAYKLGMKKGFIRIEKLEMYSYFKGIPVKSLAQQDRFKHSLINFGATGALVTSMKISNENMNNSHYVLNIRSGIINVLDKEYLIRILQPYDDLLFNFQHEEYNESLEVLLQYLDLLNGTLN